jgi:hypothetical protein
MIVIGFWGYSNEKPITIINRAMIVSGFDTGSGTKSTHDHGNRGGGGT